MSASRGGRHRARRPAARGRARGGSRPRRSQPRSFTPIAIGVGIAVLLAAVVLVVVLVANEPDDGARQPAAGGTASDDTTSDEVIDGAKLFASNCAQCHGASGEGGVAPALAGGSVVRGFPAIENEIAFVKAGGGPMPSFGALLSDAEIEAVVRYTREEL